MGAQRAKPVDPHTTLIVSTLERTGAEAVRRLVLRRALDDAQLDAVPTRIEDLTFFVSGPLYEAAQTLLGEELADDLLRELAPVLDRAWRDDWAGEAPPSDDPPPPDDGLSPGLGPQAAGDPRARSGKTRKRSAIHRVGTRASLEEAAPEEAWLPTEPPAEEAMPSSAGSLAHEQMVADTIPGPASEPVPISGPESWASTDRAPTSGSFEDEAPPTWTEGRAASDWEATSLDGLPGAFTVPPASAPRLDDPRLDDPSLGRAVVPRDETPPPPRSHRLTVPYLDAVLTPPRRQRRVLVVDSRDRARHGIATALERRGYAVITAHDRSVARTLHRRLAPPLIVADVETVAPDFEPLGPAFEDLLGAPAETAATPHVILLGDGTRRSLPPTIDRVLTSSDADALVAEVERLLPLAAPARPPSK